MSFHWPIFSLFPALTMYYLPCLIFGLYRIFGFCTLSNFRFLHLSHLRFLHPIASSIFTPHRIFGFCALSHLRFSLFISPLLLLLSYRLYVYGYLSVITIFIFDFACCSIINICALWHPWYSRLQLSFTLRVLPPHFKAWMLPFVISPDSKKLFYF